LLRVARFLTALPLVIDARRNEARYLSSLPNGTGGSGKAGHSRQDQWHSVMRSIVSPSSTIPDRYKSRSKTTFMMRCLPPQVESLSLLRHTVRNFFEVDAVRTKSCSCLAA
jgi:hypothetical protein